MKYTPDEFIEKIGNKVIGQELAKKTLAIALRNRWRRTQLDGEIQATITPKNILMIGSTGVGKTALIKAAAELIDAPMLRVEATRYTQIGYVGDNVDTIIKDLVLVAMERIRKKREVYLSKRDPLNFDIDKIKLSSFLQAISKQLNDFLGKDIKELKDIYEVDQIEKYHERVGLSDPRLKEVTDKNHVVISMLHHEIIPDKLNTSINTYNLDRAVYRNFFLDLIKLYSDTFDCYGRKEAMIEIRLKDYVENKGIVFIDEIDKIASNEKAIHDNVGKVGVQRDLLGLLDGTVVKTQHENINTENILFIAAGAFHVSKVNDLMPELLGRLPIQIKLEDIDEEIMYRILKETVDSPVKQYQHLLSVDRIKLEVTDDALKSIARLADSLNKKNLSMGARTLFTVTENLFSDIASRAYRTTDKKTERVIVVDSKFVENRFRNW